MLRTLAPLAAALLCAAAALADEADKKPGLEGTYTITKGERGGKAIPEAEIKGTVVAFTRDKVTATDKDKKEFYAATYTLDTKSKPWKIIMTSTAPKKGDKAAGVIKTDGDMVTLCYALPGGKTPTGFKAGDKQQCFVLKRVKTNTGK